MKHNRRNFLELLRTQLLTLTGFGGVWIQRIGPVRNSFPCITLFSEQETLVNETIHPYPRPQDRKLTIAVKVWIRGTVDDEKAEADMDNAALTIERKLTKPLGADDFILVATDFEVDEVEPEIHAVTLTYWLEYQTTEFSPGV